MLLNRQKPWLAGWLFILLTAVPAWSQGLQDAQLFAPAEMDQFGGGPRPNEGFFATVDYLRWTISAPDTAPVGFPGSRTVYLSPNESTIQTNTIDNGFLSADWTDGQRVEFGCVDGHEGWMFSMFRLHRHTQEETFSSVDMVFDDLSYGQPTKRHLYGWTTKFLGYLDGVPVFSGPFELRDLPVSFDHVTVRNTTETWGVEASYLLRTHPICTGGLFEFYLGARYLEFNEKWLVDGRGDRFLYDSQGTVVGVNTLLADSYWETKANNHIVGPQLGARYFRTSGRWTFSTEGRVLAGFNSQNIRQRGTLGSKLNDPWGTDDGQSSSQVWLAPIEGYPYVPETMGPTSFNHVAHESEFSPAAELRVELKYQFTRAISARFGWDVFWIDGVARPSDMVDYTLSETQIMGINRANNRQDVLMQGFHVGLELNR